MFALKVLPPDERQEQMSLMARGRDRERLERLEAWLRGQGERGKHVAAGGIAATLLAQVLDDIEREHPYVFAAERKREAA